MLIIRVNTIGFVYLRNFENVHVGSGADWTVGKSVFYRIKFTKKKKKKK